MLLLPAVGATNRTTAMGDDAPGTTRVIVIGRYRGGTEKVLLDRYV